MRVIVKPFDWVVALFSVPAFGLMLLGLVNPRGYSTGLSNADPPFYFFEIFLFLAGALLALTGVIWVLATWSRSSRATHRFGIIVAGGPVLAAILLLIFPLHMYRRGLARWTNTHINPASIRAWYAGTPLGAPAPSGEAPPSPGGLQIDMALWPADLSMLSPRHVWTVPAHGVILEWGDLGDPFSASRHIFIGADAKESAPPGLAGWMQVMPGVYATDH